MHRKIATGKVELTRVLWMEHLGSEQCGASLELLDIGKVQLTTVLELEHLIFKNA